jgi:hypothetical protein
MNDKVYVGLDEDLKEGIGPTVRLILDAKVFRLIGDGETCKGWSAAGIQSLYERVNKAWEPYGLLPSRLPEELRHRHAALFDAAVETARANGWDPDAELEA